MSEAGMARLLFGKDHALVLWFQYLWNYLPEVRQQKHINSLDELSQEYAVHVELYQLD
jgi:hypothetical protein